MTQQIKRMNHKNGFETKLVRMPLAIKQALKDKALLAGKSENCFVVEVLRKALKVQRNKYNNQE